MGRKLAVQEDGASVVIVAVIFGVLPAFFARALGHTSFSVAARADAQYEVASKVDGLFPFTLDCDCINAGDGADSNGGSVPVESERTPTPTATHTPTATPMQTPTPSPTHSPVPAETPGTPGGGDDGEPSARFFQ